MGEKSVFDALKWLLYSNLKASVTSLCPENSPSFMCSLCPSKIKSLRVDLSAKKNPFRKELSSIYLPLLTPSNPSHEHGHHCASDLRLDLPRQLWLGNRHGAILIPICIDGLSESRFPWIHKPVSFHASHHNIQYSHHT